jgi:hypothetical protein
MIARKREALVRLDSATRWQTLRPQFSSWHIYCFNPIAAQKTQATENGESK